MGLFTPLFDDPEALPASLRSTRHCNVAEAILPVEKWDDGKEKKEAF